MTRARAGWIAAFAALATLAAASIFFGPLPASPQDVLAILAAKAGFGTVRPDDPLVAIVWDLRIPRTILAILVGAALAMSGAALQGIFRNPLVDAGLLGVSSGAALGAVSAFFLGLTAAGLLVLPASAVAGAFAAGIAVWALGGRAGCSPTRLLLSGVAVGALASSIASLLLSLKGPEALPAILFWLFGGFEAPTHDHVLFALPGIAAGCAALRIAARPLDLLSLGDARASALGVSPSRVRAGVIAATSLAVGTSVAVAGPVVFVGLMVPHVLRGLAGPAHARLLPASALGGAILVLAADLASRLLFPAGTLRLGVVTVLLGGPFFLWLLARADREGGLAG